jgi:hypothetical protein
VKLRGRPEQLDLLDYPNSPGWQRPDTSVEAALALLLEIGRLQAAVLAAIRASGESGLTADEAAVNLGLTPFTARPRATELSKRGLIEDSGARRVNLSGRRAIVWRAVLPYRVEDAVREAEAHSRRLRKMNEAERQVRRIVREEG